MIDATVGGANANSYCTLAFANAYHESARYTADWFNTPQEELAAALIVSTQYIDLFEFRGYPTSSTQALKFPRSGVVYNGGVVDSSIVPIQVQQACAQMALDYIRNDFAKRQDDVGEAPVESIKAGSFEIKFGRDGTKTDVEFLSDIARLLLKPFRRQPGLTRV